MEIINIHQAKTNLSQLLALVAKGEEVIIAKAGTPVAMLEPFSKLHVKRIPGSLKGKIRIAAAFDVLPKSFLKHFVK